MARRDTGRATYHPECWLRSFAFVFILGAIFALSAPPVARAATLTDVRIGKHDQFTRVVLELDALAGYQVFEPDGSGDPVMELRLEAGASAREVSAPDALATRVEVEPSGAKSVVRVTLRKPELLINEMILLSPPRIVFDLRDPAAAAGRVDPVPQVARKDANDRPSMASVASDTTGSRPPAAVAAAVDVKAKRQAPVPPARSADAPTPVPSQGGSSEPVAALDDAGLLAPTPDAPAMESDGPSAPLPADTDPMATLTKAAAETRSDLNPRERSFDPTAAREAGLARARSPQVAPGGGSSTPPGAPLRPRAVASRVPSAPPATPPSSSQSSWMDRIVELAGGNLLYLGAAALGVLLVLGVILRRRNERDDVLSPVMAADDLGGQDVLFDDPDSVTEPVPAPVGAHEASAGSASRPAPHRMADGGMADGAGVVGVAATRASSAPTVPSASAGTARQESGTGIETRIASLESSLQQLMQAREQIERQLAAQTEELRVQRAAIARTQRAVRTIGEREDDGGATEPVPRAPAN